jgi:tetratricopeptide (TPR) repeat protein
MAVRVLGLALALQSLAGPALPQSPEAAPETVDQAIALGIAANDARDPAAAFQYFEAAIALSPNDYEANWRAAQALMDIGKQTPDSIRSPARDSLYVRAEALARVAVAADPDGTQGHYILAAAVGRAALTKSAKERIRRAAEIRNEALKAIELDPNNDLAYHVLGRWNAEIERLSGFTRFFAKSFLGAGVFNAASWEGAVQNLEKATDLAPEVIYHHLDLAEVYIDLGRYTEARQQLHLVLELPVYDVLDPVHKETAAYLLPRIEGKQDKD